jgi:hypothetical protein
MRIADVAKLFAGSCIVYFVVAACSAAYSEETPSPSSSGGPAPPTSPTAPVPNALAEGHKSGSRLKLRFYEGADGSKQFIDFFDAELKTICSNGGRTPDGKLRCLPSATGIMYFVDSGCTTPTVYAVSKTRDPQPSVAVVAAPLQQVEYYVLKGLVNAPTAPVHARDEKQAGGCALVGLLPGQNYYEVGSPLAQTAFVEMTIKTE